jgi:hypothetical protein
MLLVQYTDMRGMECSGARALVVIVVEVENEMFVLVLQAC